MRSTKEENKALCRKYPFLIPSNRFSGKRITEGAGSRPGSPEVSSGYDWEYTELDSMPDGWRTAFGEQMCEELKTALIKADLLDRYRVMDIKEKYGHLRWYDNGGTRIVKEIISKYEEISKRICICCGRRATLIALGWISPYCDSCVPDNERTVPVKKYYDTTEVDHNDLFDV